MHIGIVSHISTDQLSDFLDIVGNEPKGIPGATAPNLLVQELINKGYQVSVFSLTPELGEGETHIVKGQQLTIYYGPYRKRARKRALDLFKKERIFLVDKINEVKPSILHAHWQYEYSWAALDTNIPTLVTCRDSPIHVLKYHPSIYRAIRLVMAAYVLSKARYLTATSAYLADALTILTRKKRVSIIPNFEPDWIFSEYKQDDKYCLRLKAAMINNGFSNRKNVKVGIKAFQIFRKKCPEATLHLFGRDFQPFGPAYEWCLKHKLLENISFRGYINFRELIKELSTFHLLVHTAKEETFGNILAEAMALGLPVVAGRKSGAVPWVVGLDGKAGVLTDITSANEVSAAMSRILQDEPTYNAYSLNARHEAVSRFGAKEVVIAYEKLYKMMLMEVKLTDSE